MIEWSTKMKEFDKIYEKREKVGEGNVKLCQQIP